jgi:hypothetical protein
MSLKNDHSPILPATYPQFYNVTRTTNFANVPGWQWDPSLYNPVNTSQQLESGASGNKGAILAAWSDNGPDATTQLEAYYAMREGIPVMAARAWSGARGVNISATDLSESIALLVCYFSLLYKSILTFSRLQGIQSTRTEPRPSILYLTKYRQRYSTHSMDTPGTSCCQCELTQRLIRSTIHPYRECLRTVHPIRTRYNTLPRNRFV